MRQINKLNQKNVTATKSSLLGKTLHANNHSHLSKHMPTLEIEDDCRCFAPNLCLYNAHCYECKIKFKTGKHVRKELLILLLV